MRRFVIAVLFAAVLAFCWQSTASATGAEHTYYTIREGDTLYEISRQFNTSVALLQVVNGIEGDLIYPGQVLKVPVGGTDEGYRIRFSQEDVMLLARAIHAEARGESFSGKVAVGAVILNRINSPFFPKSLADVIFEKTDDVYQFSPVADGSINLTPDEESIQAAIAALKGEDPTNGALFFYNPDTASDKWIRTLPVLTRIGNHVFATKT
ncbi:cell wall hydrolase [Desulforudis sp. 1088]|uniref:cell wall hydrolase n=1 Tax=unclassified Candidatus Desulforudis TaxID=2635950 RepID=UPI00348182F4